MKNWILFLSLITGLLLLSGGTARASDPILNKQDAEYIFGLNRGEWEAYAKRMIHPNGWKTQLAPHDTGTQVASFDSNTGMGLSIQPLYDNNNSPPTILIVGSYYPLGSLPTFTEDFKIDLEKQAEQDLGLAYSVRALQSNISTLDGIELWVTKK